MAQRDRRSIRYEQFVKPKRRRWPWLVGVPLIGAAIAAAWLLRPVASEAHHPPRALSAAGRPVPGETYQWRAVAVGGGGFITGLSLDQSGQTFVVRTDVYGAYLWNAKADRWDQLVTAASMPALDRVQDGIAEGAYEIAVAPSRPDRLYMAIKGQVYRSDDRGAHWQLASAGNPFPLTWDANSEFRLSGAFLAVDPANPDLVLLGTPGNGLWRSADAGANWARVDSVPVNLDRKEDAGVQAPGTLVWFEQPAGGPPTGRILAMASGRGMFVSRDQGRTFTPLATGPGQPMTLRRGAFDRHGTFFGVDDATQSVWSYRDGLWHDLTREAGLQPHAYGAVAANPRADQVVVFDQGGAGFQSIDGGRSWTSISHSAAVGAGDPPWLKAADVAYFATADVRFDPTVPNRLWVAAGMGVFQADLPPGTSLAAWSSQTRGIEELVANDVVQAPGQSPVFAGWDFGLHVKDDLTAYSTTFGPTGRFMAVQQLDWTPAKPAVLVTNASDTRMGCCAEDGNAVLAGTSSDAGRTWTKFASLPTPAGTKPEDPWRMAFGTIAVSSGDPANIVWAPAFNRTPQVTSDGGRSWAPVVLPGAVGDAPGSFQQNYYQRKTLAADKGAPGVFYLVHSGESPNEGLQGLWRSDDGGKAWTRVFSGEIAPASNFAAKLRSMPGHAGLLFFTSAFAHADDTRLRRSNDGGKTWTVLPEVTRVDDIAFGKAAPGSAFAAIYISGRVGGTYGVWRSIDNAASWQKLVDFPAGTLDQVTVVGADPDVFGRVYLGYKGSGWIWGEPAACKPGPYLSFSRDQCSQVSP